MSSNWIEQENARAQELASTGKTTNNNAPRVAAIKKKPAPARIIKSVYIQESHSNAFDKLVFEQKMVKGKKAPELIEEAIELLIHNYNADFNT